jgi:hypothetical protein
MSSPGTLVLDARAITRAMSLPNAGATIDPDPS